MQKYIVLGNWSDMGRKTIKEIPNRIKTSRKLIEEHNGNMSLCFTMGKYDFVAIVDLPDEESMVKIIMKLNTMGLFETTTLRAWVDSDFVKMLSEL